MAPEYQCAIIVFLHLILGPNARKVFNQTIPCQFRMPLYKQKECRPPVQRKKFSSNLSDLHYLLTSRVFACSE